MTELHRPPSGDMDEYGDWSPTPPRGRRIDGRFLLLLAAVSVAIVGSAVAAALLAGSSAEPRYGARSDVLWVYPATSSSDARDRTLSTQREIILGRAVLLPVAEAAGTPLLDLREAVDVSLASDDVIRITVTDADRQRALSLARQVTTQYLETSGAFGSQQTRAEEIIREDLARTRRLERSSPPERQYLWTDRANRLQDRLLDLRIARLTSPEPAPRLLVEPYLLDEPIEPKPLRAAVGGLAVGLVLAAAVVVVLLRRRW